MTRVRPRTWDVVAVCVCGGGGGGGALMQLLRADLSYVIGVSTVWSLAPHFLLTPPLSLLAFSS